MRPLVSSKGGSSSGAPLNTGSSPSSVAYRLGASPWATGVCWLVCWMAASMASSIMVPWSWLLYMGRE